MTVDEIKGALRRGSELTMPRIKGLEPGDKVAQLEDFLVDAAIMRSELERARMYAQEALLRVQLEWDDIKGWEAHLGYSSRSTQEDVRRAKKEIRPDLYTAIQDGKYLVGRLGEQINRLGGMGDEQVASRLYTLITGA